MSFICNISLQIDWDIYVSGMHRKSLEAAEHLKDDSVNSDHEETTSMRTDASDTSASSNQPPQPPTIHGTQSEKDSSQINGQQNYSEDPEAFRNNSIACLRAKAQEHSAKLLTHNLMMHTRTNSQPCDTNANTLHHPDIGNSESNQGMFWQNSQSSKAAVK